MSVVMYACTNDDRLNPTIYGAVVPTSCFIRTSAMANRDLHESVGRSIIVHLVSNYSG